MGSHFFTGDEASSISTKFERIDLLDEALPLCISKTPAQPLSTQFIPCGAFALLRLNDYRGYWLWPDFPFVRVASVSLFYSRTYLRRMRGNVP